MKNCLLLTLLCLLVFSCEKTTLDTHPPVVYLSMNCDSCIEIGLTDTITISPKILYDDNSEYSWVENDIQISNAKDYKFIPDALVDHELYFSVKNSLGEASIKVPISIIKKVDFSSVDSVILKSTSHLLSAPLNNQFTSNGVVFANKYESGAVWQGFALTNKPMATSTDSAALYCVHCNSSAASAAAIFSQPSPDVKKHISFEKNMQFTPKSIDVCNSSFVYLSTSNGNGEIDAYGANNYLKLKVIGVDENDNELSSAEVYLIDNRFDNPAKYLKISKWTTVYLSQLGKISGLKLQLLTDVASTPLYVCIDNLKLQD